METSLGCHYFFLFLFILVLGKLLLKKNKNLPPSPGAALPIIGHLHLLKQPLHRTFANLSSKHGPILFLRFGSRPVILVSSPALAEECFTKNDIVFANRPRLLAGKHLGYGYTTLVWASYGPHWRNLRRIASLEILSTNRLQMFQHIRVDEVRSLVHRMYKKSKCGEFITANMKSMFFELTLNVIMRMIAGKRYYRESVAELDDDDEEKRFKEIVKETFLLSSATNIGDFLPALKWVGLNKIEKRLEILQRKRDELLQELIEERKRVESNSDSEETKTMIDVLLTMKETEPEYYTDEVIKGMVQVMLSAASETSAGTMEWALSLLLNNPEALLNAQIEIDKQVGYNNFLEETDAAKLPYLQGIISETHRMHPAAALIPPHESSEDCTIGGYLVPRGTMLLVNTWAIHNDPKLWEEPEKFEPERFLGLDGKREGFELLPFGAGRRGCPGEGLATKIIGLALGSLIQCFDWKRVGDELVDMTEGNGLSVPKAQPLLAKCRPGLAMVNLLSQA